MDDEETSLDLTPLGESFELLRTGDHEGALRRILSFAVAVWSEVPVLGKVTEEVLAALSSMSSNGRMKRAIRELEKETDRIKGQKAIAAAVVEALRDTVDGRDLSRSDNEHAQLALVRCKSEIEAALDAGQNRVRITQQIVRLGSTGVVVGHRSTRDLEIEQHQVLDPGTVGVKIE